MLSITCYSSHRRLDKSSSFSAAHRRSRRRDSLLSEPFLARQQFRIEEEARRQAEKERKHSIARRVPCELQLKRKVEGEPFVLKRGPGAKLKKRVNNLLHRLVACDLANIFLLWSKQRSNANMKRKASCGSCRHRRPLADEDDKELESKSDCNIGRIVMSTVDISL